MKFADILIARSGLEPTSFDAAYEKAVSLYDGMEIERTDRIKACAAIAYREDADLCDLGSYINIYPVVLSLLGMRVTTIDNYPQRLPQSPHYNPEIDAALDIYRSVGINVIESDLYDVNLPQDYDVITSFETFEHLWHSPKPIMKKVVAALRKGGAFILSVPNIARLGNRVKALVGRSMLPSFSTYYDKGNPFTGHRREMTSQEVDWMLRTEGLVKHSFYLASIMPPLQANASLLGRMSRFIESSPILPPSLRSQIFAEYRKP